MRLQYGLRPLTALIVLISGAVFGQEDSLLVERPYTSQADLASIQLSSEFEPSTEFNGYVHAEGGASVVMMMIHNIESEALDEAWRKDPSRVLDNKTEFTTSAGYDVIAYKETLHLKEVDFIQYNAFVENGNEVLWLRIIYPEKFDGYFESQMLTAIRNANLNAEK